MRSRIQSSTVRDIPLIGLSSLTIGCSTDFGSFSQLSPDCIELCRIGLDDWQQAKDFILNSPVPVGLHCPLPFDGLMKHFEITGPDPDRQRLALELVERTIAAAVSASAAYIVVHFPTVFTPFNTEADWHLNPTTYIEKALETGQLLGRMSRDSGIPILIENVGENPYFYNGLHFRSLFECAPNLRMCLDPGHAHVLPIGEDVYQFTQAVAPYVASVHFYNTNNILQSKGHHYLPAEQQTEADGWINLRILLRILSAESALNYLVFEYLATAVDDNAKRHMSRMRKEVEKLPWNRLGARIQEQAKDNQL